MIDRASSAGWPWRLTSSFGRDRVRLFVSALLFIVLCGCSREAHVRNKVYSILPPIEREMGTNGSEHAFEAEILNPWVRALGTSNVVARLEIAIEELPQYRRAGLWMLKAYAPPATWRKVAARYPTMAEALPDVAGYGEHPKTTEPNATATPGQPVRSTTNRTSEAGEAGR